MKAYKGFNKHSDGTLWCRDFQYEVGKTYTFYGVPLLCRQGFHACHEPWQCWVFYPNDGSTVYYEVECGGKIVESDDGDGKFVCAEITLVKEIPAPENKFDFCSNFREGYAGIELEGKKNHINTEGQILSQQWWEDCYGFYNGYAMVKLDGKWNHINTEGQIISQQWWDDCWRFQEGYAEVQLNGKGNYINADVKLLSEQWFDACYSFQYGYAMVQLKGKWNFIDTKGKYLSEQWWEDCYGFYNGYARVELNGKWYKIDKNGKIIEQ